MTSFVYNLLLYYAAHMNFVSDTENVLKTSPEAVVFAIYCSLKTQVSLNSIFLHVTGAHACVLCLFVVKLLLHEDQGIFC